MRLLGVIFLALLPLTALASYCGKSGVPYSFEVLPSGAPVLGCAQPSCVVLPDDFEEDSEFLTDASGQADGFFREGDRNQKRYRHSSAPLLSANCSGGFSQLSCPRKNQWVGGIEYIDHPRQPLILQCCSFEGLRFSQEVGMTVVGPGEAITGGEVIRNGRQISFDVVANVRKIVQPGHGHKASYEVTVRRMNCLPDPPEPEVTFDKDVPSEVLKVLSTAKNGKDLGAKEKFEKIADKKKPKNKKQTKQNPQQLAAKQHAAPSENSINVDPLPSNSNIEPLPAAPQQPQQASQQPQPPVAPQQPQPQQPQPQQPTNYQPQQPYQPQQQQQQFQPQSVQAVPQPGFGAPAQPSFPGFAPVSFPGFPAPAAVTPSPYAQFGATQGPAGYYQSSTSTWDAAISEQNRNPRPTYPNGMEVFPTIGTGFMTMTPHPMFPTFPTAAPAFGAVTTPAPAIARPQGAPDQQQLPNLATPPPLNNLEQTVRAEGSAAAISNVDGGNSQSSNVAAAAQGTNQAQAQAAPIVQAPQPAQPFAGFQPFSFAPPGQQFQFPTFPPPQAPPQFQFPAATQPQTFQFPQFPAAGAGQAPGTLPTLPTLPPMPTFSFPTLPPAPATTPHPLFTLPTPGPAQAQGTPLFSGLNPIQFPGLGPLAASAPSSKSKK